jgi:hypothetical protein
MKLVMFVLLTCSLSMASIIPPTPPAPVPLTTAQAQSKVLNVVKAVIERDLQMMQQSFSMVGGLIWSNPDGLTPQQCFDALDTVGGNKTNDASQLVQFSNTFLTALGGLGVTIPSPMPAGYSLTINTDGTVTVVAPKTAVKK